LTRLYADDALLGREADDAGAKPNLATDVEDSVPPLLVGSRAGLHAPAFLDLEDFDARKGARARRVSDLPRNPACLGLRCAAGYQQRKER